MTPETATPEELRRLLRLIDSDPQVRSEVRRAILSDELLDLPRQLAETDLRLTQRLDLLAERVDGLAEQMVALTARVDALTERLDMLTARVDALTERVDMLTARVDALTARVDALTERVDMLTARVDALTERVDMLAEQMVALTARVDALTERVDGLAQQMATVVEEIHTLGEVVRRQNDRLGRLDGWWLQERWNRHASSYLGSTQYRRVKEITPEALGALLDDAEDAGLISTDERCDVVLVDALHRTRRKDTGDEVWVATEVSARLHRGDVERADRRADILSRAFEAEVVACVAGGSIDDQALALAQSTGVLVMLPTEWRVAGAA